MPVHTNRRDQSLVVSVLLTKEEALALQPIWTDLENAECWQERRIAGCSECLEKFMKGEDPLLKRELSLAIWNMLDLAAEFTSPIYDMEDIFEGRYYYRQGNYRFCDYFVTTELRKLRELPWLMNEKGEYVTAQQVTKQTLSKKYISRDKFDDIGINKVTRFLRIRDEEESEYEKLSPMVQEQIKLGKEMQKLMKVLNTKDSRKLINAITMLISCRNTGEAEDYSD